MLNMDVKRLKQSCKKAFIIVTAVFSASVVLLAGIMAYFGWLINPEIILRLFLVYAMLFVLTVVRTYLIGTKWAQNKPYVLVNIMFAPLYFGFSMLGLYTRSSFFKPEDLLLFAVMFVVTFTIAQTITYFVKKARTDKMNDALNEFHKEHQEDGYEEEMVDGN